MVGTHLTLDTDDGSVRIRNCLSLCDLTDHTLAGLGECHNRRCGSRPFGVRNNDGVIAFHDRDARVCCTQIYTDDLSHNKFLLMDLSKFNKIYIYRDQFATLTIA